MTADELIARARRAAATPTLYFLGAGGYYGDDPQPPEHPGVDAPVKTMLDRLDKVKRERYETEARAAGIDIEALRPLTRPFCDCSGYVCWALGIPRAPARDAKHGWVWTESIYADALSPGGAFTRLDSDAARLVCRPGAMLVYPSPGVGEPGHIGIVSEVDATGAPQRVLHCSSLNFLVAPEGGAERSAIAETGPQVFEGQLAAQRPTIAVWFRALQG
jgi:hypothetical protein